jgi:hypothetical protein
MDFLQNTFGGIGMFRISRVLLSCGLAAALLLNLAPARAAEALPPPKTMDPGSPEVLAVVTIPSFNALCEHAEAVAIVFNPEFKPGMLKAQLAQTIPEPVLANLDGGKPITAFLLPPSPPGDKPGLMAEVVVYVPAKAEADIAPLAMMAQMQLGFQDGTAILSLTPAGVEKGKSLLPVYLKLAAAKPACDARVFVNADETVKQFGPLLQMLADAGLESFKKNIADAGPGAAGAPIPPEMILSIVSLYFKGGMGLLNQSDAMQLDVSLNGDKIGTEFIYQAKTGSTLAGLFAAPPAHSGKTASALLPNAAIRAHFRMNPQSGKAFVAALKAEITANPDLKDLLKNDAAEIALNAMDLLGSEASMSLVAGKEGVMEVVQAVEVTNEAGYLAMLEGICKLFGAEGALGKWYAQMGMKMNMTLTKNARQHNGAQVHVSKTEIDADNPAQKQMLAKMPMSMEMAFCKGVMVASQNSATLDSQLDKIQAGATVAEAALPLQAVKTHGAGQTLYIDADLIAYMKIVAGMDPNLAKLRPILENMKPCAPLTFSGHCGGGRAVFKQSLPLASLVQLGNAMKELGAQMAPPPKAVDENGVEEEEEPGEKMF